jgi:hypothetical protein
MRAREIVTELPSLTPNERCEIARLIFDMDEDSSVLVECASAADEAFQMLDSMEEDAKARAR